MMKLKQLRTVRLDAFTKAVNLFTGKKCAAGVNINDLTTAFRKTHQHTDSSPKPVANLANIDGEPDVITASFRVKLRNKNSEVIVRLLIDRGSEKTYMSEAAAKISET
ncbi:hypothetical protein QAD02_010490 [Eretmocerus hayati]|uniref:Uncharacterized protein n=1 Tax=Eretmocerus hayati TaxID=131215 RepID=A0ACC2NWP7_9HYME|nr:hypothetical protein QAD02_010490 [Eretmocerus hayati]